MAPDDSRYITPEALFRLRFGDAARPTWDVAILSFRGEAGSAQGLVGKLNARPIERKVLYGFEVSRDRPLVYEARLGERSVLLVMNCLWGGPQTAILVEELAALGVRTIVGFGVAGSLVDDLSKGAQIVAASGLVIDGTSRAYTGANEVAGDAALNVALVATAARLGIALTSVRIATVDALYRETTDDVRRWLSLGARAINMETAPLYAAASTCAVRAIWVGHISDTLSLTTKTWDSWHRPAEMTDVTIALTIGLLEKLA